MPEFDDYSRPIKFDIAETDSIFAAIVRPNDWLWDLADFYGELFDEMDNFIITGDEKKFSFGGPLLMDGE